MRKSVFKKLDVLVLSIGLFLIGFALAASVGSRNQNIVHLSEKTTVVLQGPVDAESIQLLIGEINEKAKYLDRSRTMYLVLDTPGGSVDDGERLISVIKTLKINMKTITLTSYSEGFNIVQSLGERLMLEDGSMMTHRAYATIKNMPFPMPPGSMMEASQKKILRMYERVAKRIGMNLTQYLDLIRSDYWVYGEDALIANMVDKMVEVTCDDSLIRSGRCPLFSF